MERLKEMMAQMQDTLTQMQEVIDELSGGETPPEEMTEEQQMGRRNKYLSKPPQDREIIDQKQVMARGEEDAEGTGSKVRSSGKR